MSLPRLVLISRRFWPLVGGAEVMVGRLAAEFARQGADVTLLTARWRPDWPARLDRQGVRVVRLPNPAIRGFGTWRYMQAIRRWLRQNRTAFDLAYVSMLKHDAYAALTESARGSFPVLLRAEGAGLTGDCHWQLDANFGLRIKRRCQQAQAFVAPSPAIQRELIAAGYARERIRPIANGVRLPAPRSADAKSAARRALAESNPALTIADGAPLAVYAGRLHPRKGLADAVQAWSAVIAVRSDARLWIVGEGEQKAALVEQISDLGLNGQVVLAGAYDDVEDFLAAADLFVFPSLEEGLSLALLEAMAAQLPAVASDIPGNRLAIDDGVHGKLVPAGDPLALTAAILSVLDNGGEAMAIAGRARVAAEFSLQQTVDRHLALYDELLSART